MFNPPFFLTPIILPLFPPICLHPFSPHHIILQFFHSSAQKPRKETGMHALKTKLHVTAVTLRGSE